MSAASSPLPISATHEPANAQELASIVQQCFESSTPVYPIGGGTSLDFGLPAWQPGVGLSLAGLNRIVDYPARDMTITVEAGITMGELRNTLAGEQQQLPIDVPQQDRVTLGGVVATNFNGPRRYGYGAVRDYVIGVHAVDGRGMPFKGGGRVVKNVAGYDFCKLLTGSLGTLGVITQLTMKLKPLVEKTALVVAGIADLDEAERVLAALAGSKTTPAAVELLSGPAWKDDPALAGIALDAAGAAIVVALEGTAAEVDWMRGELAADLRGQDVSVHKTFDNGSALEFMRRLVEFPAGDSPLCIKASVVPSATTRMISLLREIDRQCSIQAHAASGIVIARFSELPKAGLSRTLVGRIQPAVAAAHGHVVVLSNPTGAEVTHQSTWGAAETPYWLMSEVKRKFDPRGILNPGRFVYEDA